MEYNKIVILGAGKIGRSFIGQVFGKAAYEVVFIDINRELIDLLNREKAYNVVVKSENGNQTIRIENVRGLHLSDSQAVIDELASTSLAALSVGQQGLLAAIPLIAKALIQRNHSSNGYPLDVIIAENMRNADSYIADKLAELLPNGFNLNENVGLIETSIGKMVPIMSKTDLDDDQLQVFAEPYNSLILAKNGFKNPIPQIEFLSPKENIKAWVDRKLFIHNLGHAAAAYLGYQKIPSSTYLYEVLADQQIYETTRQTMLQSANILMALYPGEFTIEQLTSHIDDLLSRFQNKALGDTIFRVGCDLYRKLSPNDRLAGPIHSALKLHLPCNLLLDVVKAAVQFNATDEDGNRLPVDVLFTSETAIGFDYVLKNICKITN